MTDDTDMQEEEVKPLEKVTENEREYLERKLRGYRFRNHPRVRPFLVALDILAMCYVLNAGVQLYRLSESSGAHARLKMIANGRQVAEDLAESGLFIAGNQLYFEGRRFVDKDFDRHMAHFQHYLRRSEETKEEFAKGVERVYNPLALFK